MSGSQLGFFDAPPPTDEVKELLQRVIEWCKDCAPDWFDDSFVHAMYIRYHERGSLTPNQLNAIRNIALKFEIE